MKVTLIGMLILGAAVLGHALGRRPPPAPRIVPAPEPDRRSEWPAVLSSVRDDAAWGNFERALDSLGRFRETVRRTPDLLREVEAEAHRVFALQDGRKKKTRAPAPSKPEPVRVDSAPEEPERDERSELVLAARRRARELSGDEALAACLKWIALEAGSREAHERLGDLYSERGDLTSAREEFRAGLWTSPSDASLRAKLFRVEAALRGRELARERRASVDRMAAKFHRSVAARFSKRGQHEWALRQWERALELDPETRVPTRDSWVNATREEFGEILDGEESRQVGEAYAAAGEHRLALEYHGAHEGARSALGHVLFQGRWMTPGQRRIAALFERDPVRVVEEKTSVETALGVELRRARAGRVTILSTFLPERLLDEAARVAGVADVVCDDLFGPGAAQGFHIFASERELFDKYTELWVHESEGMKDHVRTRCSGYYGRPVAFHLEHAEVEANRVMDEAVHGAVHMRVGGRDPWWNDGVAFLFSQHLVGSPKARCSRANSTIGRAFREGLDWRAAIKTMARARIDPAPAAILRAQTDDLNAERSIKAWSYVDYLLSEPRNRSIVQAMMRGESGEKALGVSPDEFDRRWREWALGVY